MTIKDKERFWIGFQWGALTGVVITLILILA